MSFFTVVCVYAVTLFGVVFILYKSGKWKSAESMEQDELDVQMIMDPTQRIPRKEWMQVFVVLILFVFVLWAISQYFSDILSAIRMYMNL